MDWTIKTVFALLIFIFTWLYQEENQEWDIKRNLMKDANNFAVHDAAQQIVDIHKAQGRLIIDPVRARSEYEDTLKRNLGLNTALQPVAGSRLRDDVTIVDFIILDEGNATFPFLYTNAAYNITQFIKGPAVIAVIKSAHPSFIQSVVIRHDPIQIPSIHEYKYNR